MMIKNKNIIYIMRLVFCLAVCLHRIFSSRCGVTFSGWIWFLQINNSPSIYWLYSLMASSVYFEISISIPAKRQMIMREPNTKVDQMSFLFHLLASWEIEYFNGIHLKGAHSWHVCVCVISSHSLKSIALKCKHISGIHAPTDGHFRIRLRCRWWNSHWNSQLTPEMATRRVNYATHIFFVIHLHGFYIN